jgi:mycofactocin system glycosyltransferase
MKLIHSFFDSFFQAGVLEWEPPGELFEPFVSIIVPVYNRANEIDACLESLLSLDYSPSKREIIVVDDASSDHTKFVVRRYKVKLIVQKYNQGQSAARNVGVRAATGEIIAFIDSDCVADPNWLRELAPYLQYPRNTLVGGYVDSYFRETLLDRYEEVESPLNMGRKRLIGAGKDSSFYVPTCNMLVRKDAYLEVGGLDESLRVGEDVDLCWRLKKQGHRLIYVPKGRVRHKHRNRFREGFKRRFDYGTSEAALYARHSEVKKRFPWQPGGLTFLLLCCLGLFNRPFLFFPLAALILLGEAFYKKKQVLKRVRAPLSYVTILRAMLRSHYTLAYFLTYHIIRYYLLPVMFFGALFPKIGLPAIVFVLFPVLVEFLRKRPRLLFPVFLFFFLAEQAFYQLGVFRGCLKQRSFRLYRISFVHVGFLKRSQKRAHDRPKDDLFSSAGEASTSRL